jgi:hypothetical protein
MVITMSTSTVAAKSNSSRHWRSARLPPQMTARTVPSADGSSGLAPAVTTSSPPSAVGNRIALYFKDFDVVAGR